MRLFVGVWPDEAAIETLSAALAPVPTTGLRWVPVAEWHVTLAFLAEVPEAEHDELTGVLGAVAAGSRPAEASGGPALRALGRGVLCLPVAGLEEVAEAVLAATGPFNHSPDRDRAYYGHLTVARARRRAVPRDATGAPVTVHWPVREFNLVASTTAPEEPHYRPLASFRLGT